MGFSYLLCKYATYIYKRNKTLDTSLLSCQVHKSLSSPESSTFSLENLGVTLGMLLNSCDIFWQGVGQSGGESVDDGRGVGS